VGAALAARFGFSVTEFEKLAAKAAPTGIGGIHQASGMRGRGFDKIAKRSPRTELRLHFCFRNSLFPPEAKGQPK
jgi:hypothetical protein